MLLKILISFILVVCLIALCYFFTILLIKIVTKIDRCLDKKRDELGEERYKEIIQFIKFVSVTIAIVIFLTALMYNFIFDFLPRFI